MTQCFQWNDDTQCPNEAVMNGMCQMHINLAAAQAQPNTPTAVAPPVAVQWTSPMVKKHFGAISSTRDDTGGAFWGGGKGDWHVHIYNDGGAHIKVGTAEIRFLQKPNFKFSKDRWNEGVAAVRERAGDKTNALLGAMALALTTYGTFASGDNASSYISAL
jgi:hypothetical protein